MRALDLQCVSQHVYASKKIENSRYKQTYVHMYLKYVLQRQQKVLQKY